MGQTSLPAHAFAITHGGVVKSILMVMLAMRRATLSPVIDPDHLQAISGSPASVAEPAAQAYDRRVAVFCLSFRDAHIHWVHYFHDSHPRIAVARRLRTALAVRAG